MINKQTKTIITELKRNHIIREYKEGTSIWNITTRTKVKYAEIMEVLKFHHDMNELFFLEQYNDWIFGGTIER